MKTLDFFDLCNEKEIRVLWADIDDSLILTSFGVAMIMALIIYVGVITLM